MTVSGKACIYYTHPVFIANILTQVSAVEEDVLQMEKNTLGLSENNPQM